MNIVRGSVLLIGMVGLLQLASSLHADEGTASQPVVESKASKQPATTVVVPAPTPYQTANELQAVKSLLAELQQREHENYTLVLEGQRKSIDWWFSFLAIATAVIALFGILIPVIFARKERELIKQDREQIKQYREQIKALLASAEKDSDKIVEHEKKARNIADMFDTYQSGQADGDTQAIKSALAEVVEDSESDPLLQLRAKAITASENNEIKKANALWSALVELSPNDPNLQFNAGYWATMQGRQHQGAEAIAWYRLAGDHYQQAFSINKGMHDAVNNWGNALSGEAGVVAASGDLELAHSLWQAAGERYQQALSIKGDKHEAAYNWGRALSDEAKAVAASGDLEAARSLWQAAGERNQQALSIKGDRHVTANNWGNALSDEAEAVAASGDLELAHSLWQAAGERYQQALSIKGDKHEAAYNWGKTLSGEAKAVAASGDLEAARSLWQAAGVRYQQALTIKSDYHEAAYNWGHVLSVEAEAVAASGDLEAARSLLQAAGERYQQALGIKSDFHHAADNWGSTLLKVVYWLEKHGDSTTAHTLLQQAKELLLKHAVLASDVVSYNLACCFARLGDQEQSLHWLRVCQQHKTLPDCEHLSKDPDLDGVRDHPEFKKILASVCGEAASD